MNIGQELHEKLCAYVLGESEGADRAEIERELLRSPDLRAERERLESTIGAVRDAMQPAQTLSAEARDALERAVRPSPIARVPWLQLAAGIGAVGLGWWMFAQGPMRTVDVMVARNDERLGVDLEASRPAGVDPRGRSAIDRAEPAVGTLANEATKERSLAGEAQAKLEQAQLVASEKAVELKDAGTSAGAPPAAVAAIKPGDAAGAPGGSELTTTGSTSVVGARMGGQHRSSHGGKVAAAKRSAIAKSDALPPASGGGGPGMPGLASEAPSSPAPTIGMADPSLPMGDSDAYFGTKSKSAEERQLNKMLESVGYSGDDSTRRQEKSWRELTPDEQARAIELRYRSITEGCFPRPNERPRDMFFRFWGDNPFEVALLDKQSTFAVDVDTASYALARRYLAEGNVPEKAQVRTEEFVNYFASDVEAPRNATFSVHSDLTPSRFSSDTARRMLRVVVRGKDVDKAERQPMRLTFVVDVSGSMKEQNRLETVKHALRMLVAQLDARDSIAIVSFSNDARLVLPMTAVVDRTSIENAIAPLAPNGSTNSNAGLQLGYAQALDGLDPNAVNRVVFLADGVANVGETDATKILEGVRPMREKGIYLNTIGVGMNNHNDVLLEQLANKGDGVCNYVDSPKEIQRALVDRFTGAFQPIAKDVKLQVEFDPQQVMRYRLLGYENRAIADADFRNDAVDAGEIGAGHQVTALYEIEPTGRAGDGPMATVRVRWKPIAAIGATAAKEATEASFDVHAQSYKAFEASPPGHRRALVVAQFAEILRRSIHARGESLDDLIQEATKLQAQIPNDAEYAEFVTLLLRAKDAILRTMPACDELCQTIDAVRSNVYLGAVVNETGRDAQTLAEIEANRAKLEERLRTLLRQQAESSDGALHGIGSTGSDK